jgi:hypothetical protein
MEEILKIVWNNGNGDKDGLEIFVNCLEEEVEVWMKKLKYIDWDHFLTFCISRSKLIVEGLSKKDGSINSNVELKQYLELMATREAICREFIKLNENKINKNANSKEIASPFALGARFKQLSPFPNMVEYIVKRTLCIEANFYNKEWEILCSNEALNCLKDGVENFPLELALHRYLYPALLSVAELICCLPRELNFLTLPLKFSEATDLNLLKFTCSIPQILKQIEFDKCILISWIFSSTSNSLVIFNSSKDLNHFFSSSRKEIWMIFVKVYIVL